MRKVKKCEEDLALAECLIKLGCPLDLSHGYRDTPAGLKLEQNPSVGTNLVLDLWGGGSGYVLDMRVISELNLPMRVRDIKLRTDWGAREISLLADPCHIGPEYEYYEFPGESLGFSRDVVVNNFLSGKAVLKPHDRIEGLLLAVDEKPIPDDYPEHGRTTVELSIFDYRGNMFTASFKVCVDRGNTFIKRRREAVLEKRSMERYQRTRGAA